MFPLRIVRAMRCFATSTASSRALLSCDSRWLFDGGKGLKACLNAAQQLGITEVLITTKKESTKLLELRSLLSVRCINFHTEIRNFQPTVTLNYFWTSTTHFCLVH